MHMILYNASDNPTSVLLSRVSLDSVSEVCAPSKVSGTVSALSNRRLGNGFPNWSGLVLTSQYKKERWSEE